MKQWVKDKIENLTAVDCICRESWEAANLERFGYKPDMEVEFSIDINEIDMDWNEFSFFSVPKTEIDDGDMDCFFCYELLNEIVEELPYNIEIGAAENLHLVHLNGTETEEEAQEMWKKIVEHFSQYGIGEGAGG